MQRKSAVCCLVLLLAWQIAVAQQSAATSASENASKSLAKEAVFHSASLDRDMHYLVLLPRDYENGHSFAVLYLLHGLYGDYKNWDTKTRLETYAQTSSLLIVMPDANDSWYTNSATKPGDKFEDYIAKDLIAEVDGKYRTIREKRARAIAGLSMGGYGAVKLALQHPDLFAFAGSLSGAFNATQNLDDLRPEFRGKLLEVLGNAANRARSENDVFLLLKNAKEYPYFYLACGAEDFFLATDRAFVAQLSDQKISYEYHETAGGHSWDYWDASLEPLLRAIERVLASQASAHPQ